MTVLAFHPPPPMSRIERGKKRVKLTAANVKTLGDGKWSDTVERGLTLLVRGAARSYVHRFMMNGAAQQETIGPVADMTVENARAKVRLNKSAIDQGRNPAVERILAPKIITLREDVARYVAHMSSPDGHADETFECWAPKTQHDFVRSFENHVFPMLGDRETQTIRLADVEACLAELWKHKNNTARRICERLRAVRIYAVSKDEDSSRFKGERRADILHKFARNHMPKGYRRQVKHMRAMSYHNAPLLYAQLQADGSVAAKALMLLILTCAPRSSEVIDLTWQEIDMDARVWVVPDVRMKGRVTRQIPLCDDAIDLLLSLRDATVKPTDYVFQGRGGWVETPVGVKREGTSGRMGVHGMLNLLRKLGYGEHIHGFRACFDGFIRENTKHLLDHDAKELCLDHVIGKAVQEAYRDTGLLRHRTILAARWMCWLRQQDYTGSYGAEMPSFGK